MIGNKIYKIILELKKIIELIKNKHKCMNSIRKSQKLVQNKKL